MINLLPPKEKEILKQEENYKLVLILGMLALVSLLVLFLILFSIKIYIAGEVSAQKIFVETEKEEFSRLESFQDDIALVNQELSNLEFFYQNQIYLSELFEEISSTLMPRMYLNRFSYQKNNSQIILKGFCPTAKMLSEFRDKLKEEKHFEEISFPLSNWVESENINFSATFIWALPEDSETD